MNKQSHIAVVAARSGGHVIPGLTLAHEYCQKHPETNITIFTTHHPFDKKIIAQHGSTISSIFLPLDNIPSRFYHYPQFIWQFMYSLVASFYHLIALRPARIIVMGGYISIPVSMAAFLLRIPRDLYELNAVPGKATKLLAPLATTINVCFQQTKKNFNVKKTVFAPYPIRFHSESITREQAHTNLNLEPAHTTILILGGSQGSVSLNNAVKKYFEKHPEYSGHINIIHQTGSLDSTDWSNIYKDFQIPALVFDYHPELTLHYQAADLIICRAGAGTIFETIFFKKPCILVPLEIPGNNHQLHNAQAVAKEYPDLCKVIRQHEFGEKFCLQEYVLFNSYKNLTIPSSNARF